MKFDSARLTNEMTMDLVKVHCYEIGCSGARHENKSNKKTLDFLNIEFAFKYGIPELLRQE